MGSLTNGNAGRPDVDPVEMAAVRRREFEASASLISADVLWLGLDDELTEATRETRLIVTDAIRSVKPDVIITHNPDDYHGDHLNTYRLVFEAAPLTCVANIETEHEHMTRQPQIYLMDSLGGVGFHPTELVDIGDTIELKKRMFLCHESQVDWMREATSFDMIDVIETVAKFRGYQAGVRYAEGFRRVEAWYRGTTVRQLP